MKKFWAALVAAFVTLQADAQESCESGTCVPKEDMDKIVTVLKSEKCLKDTVPKFELDPIDIVVDKDGRVFYTGAAPKPFTLKMHWCSYDVTGTGKVDLVAAIKEEPEWGFRFRPKAYIGFLLAEPFYAQGSKESVGIKDVADAGLMADFFYWKWLNINVAAGYHSFGGGLGADLTKNFGAYLGYSLTWGTWQHNPNLALWFGF